MVGNEPHRTSAGFRTSRTDNDVQPESSDDADPRLRRERVGGTTADCFNRDF